MKLEKFDMILIQKIENSFWQWIWQRRYRIPLFFLLVLLIILFSNAPYVNLLFSYFFIIFISLLITPFVLDIDAKYFFILSMIFFVIAFIVWFSDREFAEVIGNYIFIVLFSGVLKAYFSS